MKNFLFILFSLVFLGCITSMNDLACDYIQSGYYNLIYEADIAYLSGDKEVAYKKIKEAEALCKLIEQPIYYEISRYIELLCKQNKFNKATYYITILVREYGYSIVSFEQKDYFQILCVHIDWDELKTTLTRLNEEFYSQVDTNLVKELKNMCKEDQAIRKEWNAAHTAENLQKMNKTDSINEIRIKEIFDQYGYPNERLIGHNNTLFWPGINTMLMHFQDTVYFPKMLLQFIKNGLCPPTVLGDFIDSQCRIKTNKNRFIYGIYNNVTDDEIWDIGNLDKRRQAIGMSTMEMQHHRDSLMKIRYGDIKLVNDEE